MTRREKQALDSNNHFGVVEGRCIMRRVEATEIDV